MQRYRCLVCDRSFSDASFHPCFRQHKRRVNQPLLELLASGISQRRAALILHIDRKTVASKLKFLAGQCRKKHKAWLKTQRICEDVQFDDLETFEHTKCKPLSVSMAVMNHKRAILGYAVSTMPAKGKLAHISRKKYGHRQDHRRTGLNSLFFALKDPVSPTAFFTSDENPLYAKPLSKHFPKATHQTYVSRKACVVGQGELKKIGHDPLFSINHTFAMLRANINRLIRRTWCTTKKISGLLDHLAIYTYYHNTVLIKSTAS